MQRDSPPAFLHGGRGTCWTARWCRHGVTKPAVSRRFLERTATEGNSPVGESRPASEAVFPSNAWHVESRVNLGGPPPKAKHSLATDSEPEQGGKGEKHPGRGVQQYQ